MLDEIRELARQAGQEILKIYRSNTWSVTAKSDDSPLTQADLASNNIIVPGLQALSSDPVVSEESDPTSVRVGRRFWLVDPLDGTRDFVARLDTFVVCIALVEDGYPVAGVIYAPVLEQCWWAEKGKGAFGPDGRRIFHSQKRDHLIVAGSRSMAPERIKMLQDSLPVQEVVRFGSALKFCKLAEGAFDFYPRLGPTSEWDTAAGQIIAEEAGCKVLDLSTGERLRYGKPNFENRGGFMASREDLDVIGPLRQAGLIARVSNK